MLKKRIEKHINKQFLAFDFFIVIINHFEGERCVNLLFFRS